MEFTKRFVPLSEEMYKNVDLDKEAENFRIELDKAKKEADIQTYIKSNQKWIFPFSILKDYDFGHHYAYLASEFPLGSDYVLDYLLIGKNSLGNHFVFVEFEDVNIDYRQKNKNEETSGVRKGIIQLQDWKRWMKKHKDYFIDSIGSDFLENDIPDWAFNYCLVVSRREKMDSLSNQLRGEKNNDIHIISYDRLADNVRLMTNGV